MCRRRGHRRIDTKRQCCGRLNEISTDLLSTRAIVPPALWGKGISVSTRRNHDVQQNGHAGRLYKDTAHFSNAPYPEARFKQTSLPAARTVNDPQHAGGDLCAGADVSTAVPRPRVMPVVVPIPEDRGPRLDRPDDHDRRMVEPGAVMEMPMRTRMPVMEPAVATAVMRSGLGDPGAEGNEGRSNESGKSESKQLAFHNRSPEKGVGTALFGVGSLSHSQNGKWIPIRDTSCRI